METPEVELIRLPEVERLVGLKRSAIRNAIAKAEFPRPIRLGLKAVRWHRGEIVQWLRSRPRVDSAPQETINKQ